MREYALSKLDAKKLNMIIANKVGADCGFDCDENSVDVYWQEGSKSFPMSDKTTLASELIALVAERYEDERGTGTQTELAVLRTNEVAS